MTTHQQRLGDSMRDESYDEGADRSESPSPIPTDGLLFKLAECISGLAVRWFGSVEPDSDPVVSPEPDYPLGWYCGI